MENKGEHYEKPVPFTRERVKDCYFDLHYEMVGENQLIAIDLLPPPLIFVITELGFSGYFIERQRQKSKTLNFSQTFV